MSLKLYSQNTSIWLSKYENSLFYSIKKVYFLNDYF